MSNSKERENNYTVLRRIWNDPLFRLQSQTMGELFPGTIKDNEVMIREDELREAGYVGKLPTFLFKLGRFGFICYPSALGEYWLRQKTIDKGGLSIYSIFKD
jgi:hypothetical protein